MIRRCFSTTAKIKKKLKIWISKQVIIKYIFLSFNNSSARDGSTCRALNNCYSICLIVMDYEINLCKWIDTYIKEETLWMKCRLYLHTMKKKTLKSHVFLNLSQKLFIVTFKYLEYALCYSIYWAVSSSYHYVNCFRTPLNNIYIVITKSSNL